MRRVVITGMSVVCSLGTNHEKVFERLCNREKVVVPIDKSDDLLKSIKTSYYTPIAKIDESRFNTKLKQVKSKASGLSYYTAYAALNAIEDAEIEDVEDASVVIGCAVPLIDGIVDNYESFKEKGRIS